MNERFYEILGTYKEGKYLYEIVESGGQHGVRCRVYVTYNELFDEYINKYKDTKYESTFIKYLENRYPKTDLYKFESIVWCWPYDTFITDTGKDLSKNRMMSKIEHKRKRIRHYIKNFEKNNVSKRYKKDIKKV